MREEEKGTFSRSSKASSSPSSSLWTKWWFNKERKVERKEGN